MTMFVLRCIEPQQGLAKAPFGKRWYVEPGLVTCGTNISGAMKYGDLDSARRAQMFACHETEIVEVTYGLVWFVDGVRDVKTPYCQCSGIGRVRWTDAQKEAERFQTKTAAIEARGRAWSPSNGCRGNARVVRFMKRVS